MKSTSIIYGILLFLLAFAVMAFRPIQHSTLAQTEKIAATFVKATEKGGPADINLSFQGDEHYYYINRGTEAGLQPNELNSLLVGKEVEVYFAKHWTPLDPFGHVRHVCRIVYKGEILFDDIDTAII
ncbi:MAG: hypothetical protein AAFY71_06360 [Bacteroidota bacterium]